jgi:hypothetical protein
MNYKITFIFSFLLGVISISSYSQNDTLIRSIGFKNTLFDNPAKQYYTVEDFNGYPADLKTSNLFYIEICKEDIKGNFDAIYGPFYKGINKNLIKKMLKKYPFKFESFTNDYMLKGKQFFMDKGFKYRLLIYSTFYKYYRTRNGETQEVWKQNFSIVIQDIETEKMYTAEKWHLYPSYVKKFIEEVKK